MVELSQFARDIFERTYAFYPGETWEECAMRVAKTVAMTHEQEEKFFQIIRERIFIPGGRYLYTAGRELFQCSNCFGFFAKDSREGWSQLLYDTTMCLSMGGGVGINFSEIRASGSPIKRMGGSASGPIALMQMVNECARHVMQGGKRRSALWFGLNWKHPDINDFVRIKDWDDNFKAMKAKKFEYPAPLDMANISVIIGDEYLRKLSEGDSEITKLHHSICEHMLQTGEPAFFNLSRRLQDDPGAVTSNACIPLTSLFLTKARGHQQLKDLVVGEDIWTGHQWAPITKIWHTGTKPVYRYKFSSGLTIDCTEDHKLLSKGKKVEANKIKSIDVLPSDGNSSGIDHTFPVVAGLTQGDGTTSHGGGIVHNVWITIGHKDEDIREYLLSTGLVKRVAPETENHSESCIVNLAPEQLHVPRLALPLRYIEEFWMQASSEAQRKFLRGLFSANGCVLAKHCRVGLKTSCRQLAGQVQLLLQGLGYRSYITTNKEKDITWHNGTYISKESYDVNISGYTQCQKFNDEIGFINIYKTKEFSRMTPGKYTTHRRPKLSSVEFVGNLPVYDFTIDAPEHTAVVNGIPISNCTEACLHPYDCCDLGSIVLPKIKDLTHLEEVTRLAIQFLYNGSIKATYPLEQIRKTAEINRRLGLGIIGLHEFMLINEHKYEWFSKLEQYMQTWKEVADDEGEKYSALLGEHQPIATRAIAPTGTISIMAESSSGIEPIFCTAYKRRYINAGKNKYQFVVDPTAKRLIEQGIPEQTIEDAYTLSLDVRRRLEVNARVQNYVDQAISSTINLPAWGKGTVSVEQFSQLMKEYLPRLKGLTTYPENGRSGQPLVPINIDEAMKHEGVIFEESGECLNGVCGI